MNQPTLPSLSTSSAIFSEDRVYRYSLRRWWAGNGPECNFIMLNPSTADEHTNDPTIERCQRRAAAMGFSSLMVTNLFGLRSTDPRELKTVTDPVGPDNDSYILRVAFRAEMIVCAWGNHGSLNNRSTFVVRCLRKLEKPLWVFRFSKTGEPSHPLYLPYDLTPIEWVNP